MQFVSGLSEERIGELRTAISSLIGERRFAHTLGVESAIVRLGECYLPDEIGRLRVAALLHDVTKEWSEERQITYLREVGAPVSTEEMATPRILHARTGALIAARDFSDYVDPIILHAIEVHTTGKRGMSVFDELLYLADYIEPTRTYRECVELRNTFLDGYAAAEDKLVLLHRTVLAALRMTVAEVLSRGGAVFPATLDAVSYFEEILS